MGNTRPGRSNTLEEGEAIALEARELTLRRGETILKSGLDLALGQGAILHVRGPNGCGKTTLLRTLAGLTQAENGSIHWYGRPVARAHSGYREQLLYLGHQPALKGALTPEENLARYRSLRAAGERSPGEALRAFGVGGLTAIPCRRLSAGQRQRVALARLLNEPATLWLLDEPFTALDRAGTDILGRVLERHARRAGIAVITAHHALPLAEASTTVVDLDDD